MKLRLSKNSVRLRLTKSEVESVAKGITITETLQFTVSPIQQLTYCLRTDNTLARPSCSFQDSELIIVTPSSITKQWAETDQVGIYADQVQEGMQVLKIIVEKDFKCLNPDGEENPDDKFENPRENK